MVQHTLSLMLSCGMYDYSGEFAFHVRIMGKKVPFTAKQTHILLPKKITFSIIFCLHKIEKKVPLDLLPKATELIPKT